MSKDMVHGNLKNHGYMYKQLPLPTQSTPVINTHIFSISKCIISLKVTDSSMYYIVLHISGTILGFPVDA